MVCCVKIAKIGDVCFQLLSRTSGGKLIKVTSFHIFPLSAEKSPNSGPQSVSEPGGCLRSKSS